MHCPRFPRRRTRPAPDFLIRCLLVMGLGIAPAATIPATAQAWSIFGNGKDTKPKKKKAEETPQVVEGREAGTSETCGYTLFTSNEDAIDFRGGRAQSCFDMLEGDDFLVLDRAGRTGGATIITGRGKDTVWATDEADTIVDEDGQSKEIRAYGGDDTITIKLDIDKDPLRELMITEKSVIRPGAGRNTIDIGSNHYTNAFARNSPNTWIYPSKGAIDKVLAICGRPWMDDVYDLRLMEQPQTAETNVTLFGCGSGFFGMTGKTSLTQVGGRFTFNTIAPKFVPDRTDALPSVTGEVHAGTSAFIELTDVTPESSLSWEGSGMAIVKADMSRADAGGRFSLSSPELVRVDMRTSPAKATWTLSSEGAVDVGLLTSAEVAGGVLKLAGAAMTIRVTFDGALVLPEIRNRDTMKLARTVLKVPEFDYYDVETIEERAKLIVEESMQIAGDPARALPLPEGVGQIEQARVRATAAPGLTHFDLTLRRLSDAAPACAEIIVRDIEGELDPVVLSCEDAEAPVARHMIANAQNYEEIDVHIDGKSWTLNMNGTSPLRVDSIEIRY